jgi:two-component system LytT family sensor kinase
MILSIKSNNYWLTSNIKGLLLGLGIGTLINIFAFLFGNFKIHFPDAMATYMFSIVISLSITNVICFSRYILSKDLNSKWLPVIAYYGGCFFGMLGGTELSYLLLWQFWGVPYHFLGHPEQIAFNLTIAIVVCSIMFVYESQKANFKLKLNQQELEVTKLKQLKTQAELQTLQSKINPHFLYNALNSIAGLIHLDTDKAEDMTLKLSKLFRYSLNSQQQNLATVKEELEVVNTYLDIEKVRFGDRINFTSHADDSVLDIQIPRFLIQPLVENALKHGLANKVENGLLNVNIFPKGRQLIVIIADNGTPFPDQLEAGYGLQSTYDKLSLLYQDDYQIEFINNPEKMVRICLPLTDSPEDTAL